jgi:hypothetical protein
LGPKVESFGSVGLSVNVGGLDWIVKTHPRPTLPWYQTDASNFVKSIVATEGNVFDFAETYTIKKCSRTDKLIPKQPQLEGLMTLTENCMYTDY